MGVYNRVMLTVRDWPNRNRLSTRVSLGSLNTILTLSGSSAGGSGGRHSDFLSFSSSSVWKSDNINQKLRIQPRKKICYFHQCKTGLTRRLRSSARALCRTFSSSCLFCSCSSLFFRSFSWSARSEAR